MLCFDPLDAESAGHPYFGAIPGSVWEGFPTGGSLWTVPPANSRSTKGPRSFTVAGLRAGVCCRSHERRSLRGRPWFCGASFDHSLSFFGQGIYQECPFEINGISHPTKGRVVYTSDNGYFPGAHGCGDKRALNEESQRIASPELAV